MVLQLKFAQWLLTINGKSKTSKYKGALVKILINTTPLLLRQQLVSNNNHVSLAIDNRSHYLQVLAVSPLWNSDNPLIDQTTYNDGPGMRIRELLRQHVLQKLLSDQKRFLMN